MSLYAVYFSPTYSTEKIVKLIANEMGDYNEIDLSKRNEKSNYIFDENDICVIGVPSYGGRVPSIALDRIKDFRGSNTSAILVVSYGNRAYEDTLRELGEFLQDRGFNCIAAVTAVTEHSIMRQFASGRPNEKDKRELKGFAEDILKKINSSRKNERIEFVGNYPYREYKGVPLKPKAGKLCNECGICAKECPTGAISLENPKMTNSIQCISCMRCISICPDKARKLNPLLLKLASIKMKSECEKEKSNELFI